MVTAPDYKARLFRKGRRAADGVWERQAAGLSGKIFSGCGGIKDSSTDGHPDGRGGGEAWI